MRDEDVLELKELLTRVESRLGDISDRLVTIEDTVWGPEDQRRRNHTPGLVTQVQEIRDIVDTVARARDEALAIKDASKEIRIIGIAVVGLMIPAVGLLLSIAGVV